MTKQELCVMADDVGNLFKLCLENGVLFEEFYKNAAKNINEEIMTVNTTDLEGYTIYLILLGKSLISLLEDKLIKVDSELERKFK